jgi:hypothetical protein
MDIDIAGVTLFVRDTGTGVGTPVAGGHGRRRPGLPGRASAEYHWSGAGTGERWAALRDPDAGTGVLDSAGTCVDQEGGLTSPHGRILAPTGPVREEAIPHVGLRIQRTVSRARWIDGSTHLWISRRRRVGIGTGSSGLRFDQADPRA